LDGFGTKYRFEGFRGLCNKANIRKLLAFAYYKTDSNWQKIETLLNQALTEFTRMEI